MKALMSILTCFVLILNNANFDHFRYKDKTEKITKVAGLADFTVKGIDRGEPLSYAIY